jgi:hypothetical protein
MPDNCTYANLQIYQQSFLKQALVNAALSFWCKSLNTKDLSIQDVQNFSGIFCGL